MGKRKHRKGSEKGNARKNGNSSHVTYEDLIKGNPDFEAYYKAQNICPEVEWNEFITALKSDLPTAFRLTGSKEESKLLLKIVEGQYFSNILNDSKSEEDAKIKPVCLPWYPDKLGWQILLTRRDIRRSEAFFKLHNFLIAETASGCINRQEVVSMIPPIALDVKSHHKVLDMCAAPGSKTAQLIEFLHKGEERMPSGFVIANDVDNNRCYMLVHQAKRLSSPNFIITNHDATIMPNFIIPGKEGKETFLKFDRILCDVPCSGDGTLRKNPDIWQKWNTANGANLHGIQYRVLKRGCEMLAVGGRLVYSTCSLNPVENEAVVARIILESQGALQLVDGSSLLPGLKFTPGLSTWLPMAKDLTPFKSFNEVTDQWKSSVHQHMFPPSPEDAERLHLNKCIRVLPHFQDTGAFFIGVLEKTKHLPWESAANDAKRNEYSIFKSDKSEAKEPARKKKKVFGYKEDPFIFFESDDPSLDQLKTFYGLKKDFPANCLLARCKEGRKKNLYLTSPQVREIVMRNAEKFKIINTGVKTFARCENKEMNCSYRLVQEGLWSIFPLIGEERHVIVNKDDLIRLLSCEDLARPPLTASLSQETQDRIAKIGQGSCVLLYRDSETGLKLELVGWTGSISTRAYVSQSDSVHYLRILGGDISKFEVNKFKKDEKPQEDAVLDESTNEKMEDNTVDGAD